MTSTQQEAQDREAQLIIIGGTLCCSFNAGGKLEPAPGSIDDLLEKAGFNLHTKLMPLVKDGQPYVIDSIDFDIGEHYKPIRDAAIHSLKTGHTPVICGGTDTKIWYATMLTKDLKRMGFLKPGTNEKVVFLSSMKSLSDKGGREHVENILRAGKLLSEQKLSGGFALSAQDEEATRFAVHDVLNHFEKISSSLTDAFRSKAIVGDIEHGQFQPTGFYNPPLEPEKLHSTPQYSRIAPPLLLGSDSEMILRYMKTMGEAEPKYDGILIEGFPKKHGAGRTSIAGSLNDNDKLNILNTVRWLTKKGVRVTFCNPVQYDNNPSKAEDGTFVTMKPLLAKGWDEVLFAESLKTVGAKFVDAMPKEAYLDMVLQPPTAKLQDTSTAPVTGREKGRLKTLGIRYVPNSEVVCESINRLAPQTKQLGFSALPHNVLPNNTADTLRKHAAYQQDDKTLRTTYGVTFEYSGNEYKVPQPTFDDPHAFVMMREGLQVNPYAAGNETKDLLTEYTQGPDIVHAAYNNALRPSSVRTSLKRGDGGAMRVPMDR